MVTFCGECFYFGYMKLYHDYYYYSGLHERLDDHINLARACCPNCNSEELVEVDGKGLCEALQSIRRLAEASEICLTVFDDVMIGCEESALEYSVVSLAFAAAGLGKLRFKKLTSSGWSYRTFDDFERSKAEELLEKAVEKNAAVVVNAIELVSKADMPAAKEVLDVLAAKIRSPECLANLI